MGISRHIKLVGGFKHVIFSIIYGIISLIGFHIFEDGWNHQPDCFPGPGQHIFMFTNVYQIFTRFHRMVVNISKHEKHEHQLKSPWNPTSTAFPRAVSLGPSVPRRRKTLMRSVARFFFGGWGWWVNAGFQSHGGIPHTVDGCEILHHLIGGLSHHL